ncbi:MULTISPECIES: hypothetical protein [Citromicrobium]|uniref:hypothetical protein n=1 Tax=Citromicrobium TaxID=72173 RepID=UPI0001DD0B3D|nr:MULTISPECIES: hypothetical protein [Citromicrobium]ALG60253.1 hypothetical protein WG74_04840 [Citromicrobium sp. JL477]KPM18921.1 hypothetical protein VO58_02210 [Citromicrobium sp. JL1351]KPM20621.1 hypothetical protein VM77_02720 [Citromicrobium sp. JL31]KPM29909.1 hypothetical protein VO57_02210 [Citromicrobium sp. JL2201]
MRKIVALSATLTLALAASAFAEDGTHGHEKPADGQAEADAATQGDGPLDAPTGDAMPSVRLPGFAAALANQPLARDADGWPVVSDHEAWQAIAGSNEQTRQAARWRYARSLIGKGRAAEAYGVLVTMAKDDPDLSLVPAHRLALGATLVELDRPMDALDMLATEQLAQNPEACAWRLRAMAALDMTAEAVGEWTCARGAIASRTPQQGGSFLLAAAQAALDEGRPRSTLALLKYLPDADPDANLIRGRALFRLGSEQQARLRLDRAAENGSQEQQIDARISLLEGLVAQRRAKPGKALEQLERLGYVWRGGSLERRGLKLRFSLAEELHDDRAALAAGAALLRYHPVSVDTGEMLQVLQGRLQAILAPDSKVPLPEAAGLFWDYRDLSPSGAGGDLLVSRLADRLQGEGLYERAAELLDYQLMARAKDVAQGPLSVRVAKLYILADKPTDAVRALRATDGNIYPNPMLWARLRIEAVALHKLGRTDEALAVLDGVPQGDAIRDEIEWGRQNWQALTGSDEVLPSQSGGLTQVEQTVVLRRAVALAMLGRETSLQSLRARYATAFAGKPTAAAFDLLTGPVEDLDPAAVAQAMAAMPTASPAGEFADLLAGETRKAKTKTKKS